MDIRKAVEAEGSEVQEEIMKLAVTNMPVRAIQEEINNRFQTELTHEQIKRYVYRQKQKNFNNSKDDKAFQNKLINTAFDTIENLKKLNSEIWEMFYGLKKDPDFQDRAVACPKCNHNFKLKVKSHQDLLKTADHLLKQISHQDAVLGKLQNKQLTVNYNYVDLSKKLAVVVPKLMQNLEKQGVIKIKSKKRLNTILE